MSKRRLQNKENYQGQRGTLPNYKRVSLPRRHNNPKNVCTTNKASNTCSKNRSERRNKQIHNCNQILALISQ